MDLLHMFDDIISLENLFTAWNEFRPGKRSTQDVQDFERNLEDHVFRLHWELKNGKYKHGKYERFQIFLESEVHPDYKTRIENMKKDTVCRPRNLTISYDESFT